jgi:hypothetical protein
MIHDRDILQLKQVKNDILAYNQRKRRKPRKELLLFRFAQTILFSRHIVGSYLGACFVNFFSHQESGEHHL